MTAVDVLGRVDELTDGTGDSVDAVMGAAIDPYRKSRVKCPRCQHENPQGARTLAESKDHTVVWESGAYQLVRRREAGAARRRDRHGEPDEPPQRIASIAAVIVE